MMCGIFSNSTSPIYSGFKIKHPTAASSFASFVPSFYTQILTLFLPMLPFDPPENIREPLVF